MAYRSKVECDGCGTIVDAPTDGGFPDGWTELNTKPSLRGKDTAHLRKRQHWCGDCMAAANEGVRRIRSRLKETISRI